MSDELSVVADPDVLETFTDHLRAVASEAVVEFRDDSIYAEMTDPSNVAMVNITIDRSRFEAYHSSGFKMGLNLERFEDYVTTGDGPVELTYDPETRRLDIQHPNTSFSMAGINPESVRDGTNVDETGADEGFVVDVTLDGAALAHGVDVAGMVSNHLTIDAAPDRDSPMHIIGEGDTDDASVEYGSSLHEGSTVDSAAQSLYSNEYLDNLTDPMPKQAAIRLRTGDEWPLRMDYELFDGEGTVVLMCAPRIKTK